MSIRAAQSAALSSLQASQSGIAVASNNIANASVEGYTAKSQSLATNTLAGATTGVTVTATGSTVDSYLLKSISQSATESGYADVFTNPLTTVSSAFGTVGEDNSLSTMITDLETSLATLATNAGSTSQKSLVLGDASEIADNLNSLSQTVQDERGNADQKIDETVEQVNNLLYQIQSYNEQLTGLASNTVAASELTDARNQAINDLSALVNVTYFTDSTNQTQVYLGGTQLVGSQVNELSYTPSGAVGADTTFGDITVNGKAVTGSITGGTLGGLIELRDETLPDIQDQLDNLAVTLMDSVNAITNQGTAYPGVSDLTSSHDVAATDALSGSGTVRLIATDDSGNAVEIVDIDLSTVSTVQDLADAINASGNLTATFNSDGTLSIGTNSDDVNLAIANMDAAIGADDQGFSDYFGLNDMFTGTSAADISLNSAWADNPSLLPSGSASSDATLAVGDNVIAVGTADIATSLSDLFDDNLSFDAAGGMGATSSSLSNYAAEILSDVARQASDAQTNSDVASTAYDDLVESFSNQYGVNLDEEALTLSNLESAYSAAASVIDITKSMMDTLLEMVQ
ncbi:flagellar hook-associated protein FlgK [Thalassospira marina]|uniref:Flagellar hook-associated protein 1 n=1 Tax=Thalassospira marina TaxID=2048283 RepID=A0ABM6Q4H9_9PROT|nr:flagellar hook-associated protein FlgK [Thalassospira marina]AUG51387.1 flagellar hook-associated protein FlgK [Thalassospira marina]